jgi:hypothetical protein
MFRRATARLAVTVDLPTPPFPDATAMTLAMPPKLEPQYFPQLPQLAERKTSMQECRASHFDCFATL